MIFLVKQNILSKIVNSAISCSIEDYNTTTGLSGNGEDFNFLYESYKKWLIVQIWELNPLFRTVIIFVKN